MIHVGVTGTQKGANLSQRVLLKSTLRALKVSESWLHHGDCIGVDAEAHAIARELGYKVRIHPPRNPGKRAWCDGDGLDAEREYLDRNRAIVKASSTGLIAVPAQNTPTLRSGTWATIRYATRLKLRIFVIYPNGTLQVFTEGAEVK